MLQDVVAGWRLRDLGEPRNGHISTDVADNLTPETYFLVLDQEHEVHAVGPEIGVCHQRHGSRRSGERSTGELSGVQHGVDLIAAARHARQCDEGIADADGHSIVQGRQQVGTDFGKYGEFIGGLPPDVRRL